MVDIDKDWPALVDFILGDLTRNIMTKILSFPQ